MRKIKKKDDVIITSGKDKGKRGVVIEVKNNDYVVVANINLVKNHKKANARGESGGIVNKEMPLHISNVALFNSHTNKQDKIGFKILQDKRKVRVFKSTQEVLDR